MNSRFLSTLVAAGIAACPVVLAQSAQTDKDRAAGAEAASSANRNAGGMSASQVSGKDQKFIMDAAQDGMAEVELGQLAQQKASNPEVKSFGQKMVEQHTQANEELKSIASKNNVTLPTDLEAKLKANVDRLSKLEGEQFDKAYMQHMVQDHKKAVSLFEKTSKSAKNEDVKQFAAKTLPTLRDHLQNAQTVNSATSNTGSASRQKSMPSDTTGAGQSGSSSGHGQSSSQKNPDTTRQP